MIELLNLDVDKMAGINYKCTCGRSHTVKIENIKIGSGVINELPNLLKDFYSGKVFIIEDKNTYKAAGNLVEDMLKNKGFNLYKYIFSEEHLIPDENALGRLIVEIPEDTAVILAIGSGSINDISRFLSYKLHIPYIIVCTSPSMDGYASVVSPLIIGGVKTTYNAVYPYAINADIDIMKEAPIHMIHAGLGDILGKYTALADWRISEILNKEYSCNTIKQVVLKAVNKCIEVSGGILSRDSEAIKSITEALILSGLAIGMTGTSRPASGEEHHLSHCWEMVFMNEGRSTKWLHGNNVGVGVGIITEAYKYLNSLDIKQIYASDKYKYFDKSKWVKNLEDVYSISARSIIELKEKDIIFDEEKRECNMKKIVENWTKIMEIYNLFLPKPEEVRNIMKNAGAIYNPSDLGIGRELFKKSFIAAKDIRRRYGVLQLLEDIGKLEEAAEVIANIYYSINTL
jgi:glycerol-1-phosphate dehydrogenase [NAD(P)+]